MKVKLFLIPVLIFSIIAVSCGEKSSTGDSDGTASDSTASTDSLRYEEETNLVNVRQLTFGGNNAEAYFSYDNKELVFQSDYDKWGVGCDQIFRMKIDEPAKEKPEMVSTGMGRTTCSYFLPDNDLIVYASTHLGGESCPEEPSRFVDGKYVWPIFDTYDIFVKNRKTGELTQLTTEKGYDAEATVSPDGQKIVFTSTRSGDLELWTMNIDGSDQKQITNQPGYDGGAFFSPDGTKLVFRSSRPKSDEELKTYQGLLKKGLVQPTELEIYTCNVDGSDLKKITELGGANWAPYWHPSGDKIIFASNHHSKSGRQFNLFLVNTDGTDLKQVTFDSTFDSFPMFSYDGKMLVFSSNRFNGGNHDTNVFLADWKD